jgi:hypothetical protein
MNIDPNQQQRRQQSPPQQKIDPSLAESVSCEKCDCTRFSVTFFVKKISALVSPTGKSQLFPIQTFQCYECGHINKELDPNDLENLKNA